MFHRCFGERARYISFGVGALVGETRKKRGLKNIFPSSVAAAGAASETGASSIRNELATSSFFTIKRRAARSLSRARCQKRHGILVVHQDVKVAGTLCSSAIRSLDRFAFVTSCIPHIQIHRGSFIYSTAALNTFK